MRRNASTVEAKSTALTLAIGKTFILEVLLPFQPLMKTCFYVYVNMDLPNAASLERTSVAAKEVEDLDFCDTPFVPVMRGAFVVRLGPGTESARGQFEGWVEEMDAGKRVKFQSSEELLRFLRQRFGEALRLDRELNQRKEQ
jgi:hypothetical protein